MYSFRDGAIFPVCMNLGISITMFDEYPQFMMFLWCVKCLFSHFVKQKYNTYEKFIKTKRCLPKTDFYLTNSDLYFHINFNLLSTF